MTWKAKQDGTDGQGTPEIKSFFMRRKQNLETGKTGFILRYTLKGMSDSQEETLEIAAGDTKMELQRVVRCAERQLRDGCRNHRPGGCLVLSGRRAGREKYLKRRQITSASTEIPYLFSAATPIELTENRKTHTARSSSCRTTAAWNSCRI